MRGLNSRNPNQGTRDVPAWLSLILAARRVPLRGVCRESHRVIRSAPNTAMSQARTQGSNDLHGLYSGHLPP